jgi:hypothetical protein
MSEKTNAETPPVTTREKKAKDRSPSYPAISLQRALEFTQKLWDAEKRQPVMVPRAVGNLGFSVKSSGGLLAIAAMKKYGLLDDEGNGDARKVKLTETGIALLNPSAPNRMQMLKQAALLPPIHLELWEKFGSGASDGNIHDYLVFERKFNEQAATTLIGQFRDTITFAKVGIDDKVLGEEASGSLPHKTPIPPPAPSNSASNAGNPTPPMTPLPGLIDFPVPLPSGAVAYYRLPSSVSETDFTFYQTVLVALKAGLVKAVPSAVPAKADTDDKADA